MTGRQVVLKLKIVGGGDPKDFYLLSLAKQIKAQYLITGDKGLLFQGIFYEQQIFQTDPLFCRICVISQIQ